MRSLAKLVEFDVCQQAHKQATTSKKQTKEDGKFPNGKRGKWKKKQARKRGRGHREKKYEQRSEAG
jgi:hypothetical protein